MVTSNLPFQEWTEVLSSERLTGALLDRLTHHVHILEMNADSYRLKQSRAANGPILRTHLGVEVPLPLRSRGPSTPHTQQPDLATKQLAYFYSAPVAWFYSALDSSVSTVDFPAMSRCRNGV